MKEEKVIFDDLKKDVIEEKTDLTKVLEILMDERYKRRKTRLSKKIIGHITVLDTLAQIWDIDFLKNFLDSYTEYLTSVDGKARQEVVDIAKYSIEREKKDKQDIVEVLGKK